MMSTAGNNRWNEEHFHLRLLKPLPLVRPVLSILDFRLVIYKVRSHFATVAMNCWPNFQIDLFDQIYWHYHHRHCHYHHHRLCHCLWPKLLLLYLHRCQWPGSWNGMRRVLTIDNVEYQMVGRSDLVCNTFDMAWTVLFETQFHLLFVFRHFVSNTVAATLNHWLAVVDSVDMWPMLMAQSHLNIVAN